MDVLCVVLPTCGYLDQMRNMLLTKSSKNFKIHTSLILLVSNGLRILYWIAMRFDKYLLFQSVFMILIHVILSFLYFKYHSRENIYPFDLPDEFLAFVANRGMTPIQFRLLTSETFFQFFFSLVTLYIFFGSIYFGLGFVLDKGIIADMFGITSNLIDCLTTFPQFVIVVIYRDTTYITKLLVYQYLAASVMKFILLIIRPAPWPFMFGVAVQSFLAVCIAISYFRIAYGDMYRISIAE